MLPPHADKPHPTNVRHWVVGLATAMAVLLYLDRICLSITERYIKEDVGLSDTQVGFLLSAFFWTYALAQVPSGWLSDRYGGRRVLTAYIVLWSLFTGLLGVAYSFMLLVVFRLSVGLAQAGAYPTSAALLSKWAPLRSRGLASAIVSTGGRVGGFLAPLLTAYLMVALVPLDTSSRLEPGDLLDSGDFCRALSKDTGPQASLNYLLRIVSPELRTIAADGAKSGNLTPEQDVALLAALNEVLVNQDLASPIAMDELDIPPEARRLGEIPRLNRSASEQQRLNRLILEAGYPRAIRKIYGKGWRPVMLIYGIAGIVVAGLFWLGVRDRPELHPSCNAAEIALIAEGRPMTPSAPSNPETIQPAPPHGIQSPPLQAPPPARPAPTSVKKLDGIPLGPMLRSRSLWLSSVSQFMTNFGWVFIITWMPRYLEEVYKVPVKERGWMASVPILVGMMGMMAGGPLTDRLTRALGLRWGRGLPMALTRFVAVAAFLFLACTVVRSPWQAMLVLSVMAVSVDLGTPAIWAFCQDVGGRHVGSILGWGNMWGNLGAAVSPLALNWIKGPEGRWDLCFFACAAAFSISGLVSLGIDARIPVVPADDSG
jgi:nitrate/nitrite transporter NarK